MQDTLSSDGWQLIGHQYAVELVDTGCGRLGDFDPDIDRHPRLRLDILIEGAARSFTPVASMTTELPVNAQLSERQSVLERVLHAVENIEPDSDLETTLRSALFTPKSAHASISP